MTETRSDGAGGRLDQFDLLELGILHRDDVSKFVEFALSRGKPRVLRGGEPGSLEIVGSEAKFWLVDGQAVKASLTALWSLYAGPLLALASTAVGRRLYISERASNGVNLNIVKGIDSRYEWHVDSNPVTGLLFLTSHFEADGGALAFRSRGRVSRHHPVAGQFLVFDGRALPHCVEPLRGSGIRVSAPMNYFETPAGQSRPAGLDERLYA